MSQHPSPIARLSRELGDSGTKEILPPTERNLTMLSEGKLEELEKVALEATPGPYAVSGGTVILSMAPWPMQDGPSWCDWDAKDCERPGRFVAETRTGEEEGEHNAAFFATFDPPTVLALISELRALRAERDAAQEELCLIGEENAGHVRLLDWVSDRLGLPHDEDVSAEHLSAVFSRLDAAEAELAALRAQAPAGFSGDEPSRAKSRKTGE